MDAVAPSLDPVALRRACSRFLSLDHRPDPAAALAKLAAYAQRIGVGADQYGAGDLADVLERRVAELLGKEASLFLPSGKMAQMIALRILTGRSGCRRVAMHPRAHFEEYEARAYQELHGLTATRFGSHDALPTLLDLEALLVEPVGAVTLEMPLRRLGCLLHPWDELTAIAQRARASRVPLHLDGARLWESQPFYDRPHAEIAGLFDTVYVALDKGLGGLAGGMLAGDAGFIAEARIWQRRTGGRMLRTFPYLLSALQALEERLPLMGQFHAKARAIAATLDGLPGVLITPNPPQANAFLVTLPGSPTAARQARLDIARETSIWLFDELADCSVQGLVSFEISVRGATVELGDGEIGRVLDDFRLRCGASS
jgi:threonine aldolase